MIAKNRESAIGYLFLSPAMLILGLFLFLPTLLSIYYAFTDYYLLTPDATSFVGLDNFVKLFQDPLFMQSLKNIGQFVIFIIPIQLGLALGLALLVNNKRKSTIFFKVAFFAPVVMSLVVVSV